VRELEAGGLVGGPEVLVDERPAELLDVDGAVDGLDCWHAAQCSRSTISWMGSSCSLDADGRAEQVARYAALAPSVRSAVRESLWLEVEFKPGFDRAVLDELVAVERECCPFLTIEVDEARLRIAVDEHADTPMLDVFTEVLGATPAQS
jgi:hypothetical protein